MASANFYFLENLEDKYQGPVNLREWDRGSDHIPVKQYSPTWAKKGDAAKQSVATLLILQ